MLLRLELFVIVVARVSAMLPRYLAAVEVHSSSGKPGLAGACSVLALAEQALRCELRVFDGVRAEAFFMARHLRSSLG